MNDADFQKDLDKISDRIKQLRIDAGYTSYEKFANANGFQLKQYWRLESGKNFQITTLLKLLKLHNISMEDFFKGL